MHYHHALYKAANAVAAARVLTLPGDGDRVRLADIDEDLLALASEAELKFLRQPDVRWIP